MPITLGEFAQKLGEAGILAARACEHYAQQRIEDAFEDDNGALVPKTKRIRLYGQEIDVPEVTLISERRVDVDRMNFEFEATVTLDDTGKPMLANHVGLLRRGVKVKAQVSFKAEDSLESLELIRERVNREVSQQLGNRTKEGD